MQKNAAPAYTMCPFHFVKTKNIYLYEISVLCTRKTNKKSAVLISYIMCDVALYLRVFAVV